MTDQASALLQTHVAAGDKSAVERKPELPLNCIVQDCGKAMLDFDQAKYLFHSARFPWDLTALLILRDTSVTTLFIIYMAAGRESKHDIRRRPALKTAYSLFLAVRSDLLEIGPQVQSHPPLNSLERSSYLRAFARSARKRRKRSRTSSACCGVQWRKPSPVFIPNLPSATLLRR